MKNNLCKFAFTALLPLLTFGDDPSPICQGKPVLTILENNEKSIEVFRSSGELAVVTYSQNGLASLHTNVSFFHIQAEYYSPDRKDNLTEPESFEVSWGGDVQNDGTTWLPGDSTVFNSNAAPISSLEDFLGLSTNSDISISYLLGNNSGPADFAIQATCTRKNATIDRFDVYELVLAPVSTKSAVDINVSEITRCSLFYEGIQESSWDMLFQLDSGQIGQDYSIHNRDTALIEPYYIRKETMDATHLSYVLFLPKTPRRSKKNNFRGDGTQSVQVWVYSSISPKNTDQPSVFVTYRLWLPVLVDVISTSN